VDEGADAPFELRDVEGLRFDEGGNPDRETMRPHEGVMFVTRRWSAASFSPAAWESEEKARRVGLLQRDLERGE
jgi:hypothetical protein